jgi:hypothetical protein
MAAPKNPLILVVNLRRVRHLRSIASLTPEQTPQTLKLEAIFTLKGQKIATNSGQNFVKGDFAFGKRVAQIFKNRVVLDDGGKEEKLILEGTKFTIRKHMQN